MDHGMKMPNKKKKLENNLAVILQDHPKLFQYAKQRALITHEQKSRVVKQMRKMGKLQMKALKSKSLLQKALNKSEK